MTTMSKLWLMSRLPLLAQACSEPEAFKVLKRAAFCLRDHRSNDAARSTLWPAARIPYYDLSKDWGSGMEKTPGGVPISDLDPFTVEAIREAQAFDGSLREMA